MNIVIKSRNCNRNTSPTTTTQFLQESPSPFKIKRGPNNCSFEVGQTQENSPVKKLEGLAEQLNRPIKNKRTQKISDSNMRIETETDFRNSSLSMRKMNSDLEHITAIPVKSYTNLSRF